MKGYLQSKFFNSILYSFGMNYVFYSYSFHFFTGLFNGDHMKFEIDKKKNVKEEPSIAAMTKTAISILQKNSKGFFLMVEG